MHKHTMTVSWESSSAYRRDVTLPNAVGDYLALHDDTFVMGSLLLDEWECEELPSKITIGDVFLGDQDCSWLRVEVVGTLGVEAVGVRGYDDRYLCVVYNHDGSKLKSPISIRGERLLRPATPGVRDGYRQAI